MEELVVFSVALGKESEAQAEDCRRTLHAYLPDVPYFLLTEENYHLFGEGRNPPWPGEMLGIKSLVGWFLSLRYETVIFLDTDVFVLSDLRDLRNIPEGGTLTLDNSRFFMQLPDLPKVNCGVVSGRGKAFWMGWSWAQFAYLLPPIDNFFIFDQLSLRLLTSHDGIETHVLSEPGLMRYYNVRLREAEGAWSIQGRSIYKGESQAMLYHQAGEKKGLGSLPKEILPFVREVVEEDARGPLVDGAALWKELGEVFTTEVTDFFTQLPVLRFDSLFSEEYRMSNYNFRSAAPMRWDRFRKVPEEYRRIYAGTEKGLFYQLKESVSEDPGTEGRAITPGDEVRG